MWLGGEDTVFDGQPDCLSPRHDGAEDAGGGLLELAEVKRIRCKLELGQREATARLGGGPTAFQKYGAGEVPISQAISNLLRLLDRDPSLLALLGEEAA